MVGSTTMETLPTDEEIPNRAFEEKNKFSQGIRLVKASHAQLKHQDSLSQAKFNGGSSQISSYPTKAQSRVKSSSARKAVQVKPCLAKTPN